jgi:hypothetical protein
MCHGYDCLMCVQAGVKSGVVMKDKNFIHVLVRISSLHTLWQLCY